jgi:hypothetical protein
MIPLKLVPTAIISFTIHAAKGQELHQSGNALLKPGEVTLYSFTTSKGKQVLLAKEKADKYIVYRFGSAGNVELEFPADKSDSWQAFQYSYYLRGGGPANAGMELNYVYFSRSGFRYIIYDNYFSESDEYHTGIRVINLETEKTVNIKGVYNTRQGNMASLRDNERISPGEELFD